MSLSHFDWYSDLATLDLVVGRIDPILNVAFQMNPTPLEPFPIEIHLRSVTVWDHPRVVANP